MSWIKPKVGTVCFGVAASQGALLLAGGEKGMRFAMPNSRIMIHQPQSGCGGHVEDVRRQVNEAVQSRHEVTFFTVNLSQKIDKMYTAFTGQPLEKVQQYTERDRFLSVTEAMEFGLIDGILETEY
ncbi:ATP-dependent Clp protease proteolytic subunit 6 chloroplastic [Bienertia sinuspersici]